LVAMRAGYCPLDAGRRNPACPAFEDEAPSR
jgi:hypothetical protein